jgi:hypothetical protein
VAQYHNCLKRYLEMKKEARSAGSGLVKSLKSSLCSPHMLRPEQIRYVTFTTFDLAHPTGHDDKYHCRHKHTWDF